MRTTRIDKGFYSTSYKGHTIYVEDLREDVEGDCFWHVRSSTLELAENEYGTLFRSKKEALYYLEELILPTIATA
jgi:hypothetical protein